MYVKAINIKVTGADHLQRMQLNAFVNLKYHHRESKIALPNKNGEPHLLKYTYRKRNVSASLDIRPSHKKARDGPLFKVCILNCEKFKQGV